MDLGVLSVALNEIWGFVRTITGEMGDNYGENRFCVYNVESIYHPRWEFRYKCIYISMHRARVLIIEYH